jgi:hypothetical protein
MVGHPNPSIATTHLTHHTGPENKLHPSQAGSSPHLHPKVPRVPHHQRPRETPTLRRADQRHASERYTHPTQQSLHIASHRSHTFPYHQTCSPTNTTNPDYVQALQDESRIRAEKIGSGNWYWSFISDDKLALQRALEGAQTAYEKALATDNELKAKIAEGEAQRKKDEEMLDGSGDSREQLLGSKRLLEGEIEGLRRELAIYSDNDPAELERKEREAAGWKVQAGVCTDDVYSIESWLKELTGGGEALVGLLREMYGSEWDDEVGGLKELA